MINDPYMLEVFPLVPIVAYRRPKNLRDLLIRAKLPSSSRPNRKIPGMKKCRYNCDICQFINVGKEVKATSNNTRVKLEDGCDCLTRNIVYCITCNKCGKQYIGESEKTLRERTKQHIGYIRNKMMEKTTGEHFNSYGHSLSDMKVTVLEKIRSSDPMMRKQKEKEFILKFNTIHKGLNRRL